MGKRTFWLENSELFGSRDNFSESKHTVVWMNEHKDAFMPALRLTLCISAVICLYVKWQLSQSTDGDTGHLSKTVCEWSRALRVRVGGGGGAGGQPTIRQGQEMRGSEIKRWRGDQWSSIFYSVHLCFPCNPNNIIINVYFCPIKGLNPNPGQIADRWDSILWLKGECKHNWEANQWSKLLY